MARYEGEHEVCSDDANKKKIVFAGINHNDPLGRTKILALLNQLRLNDNFIPNCIAVEWDEKIAEFIISQRPKFIKLAKEEDFGFTEETLTILADTIAFEADSHYAIYPDLPIIWLDKYDKFPSSVESHIKDRLYMYTSCFQKLNKNEKNSIELLSRMVWGRRHLWDVDERDEKFFTILVNETKDEYSNIFIIVGADHTVEDSEERFISRLKKENDNIQVYVLN